MQVGPRCPPPRATSAFPSSSPIRPDGAPSSCSALRGALIVTVGRGDIGKCKARRCLAFEEKCECPWPPRTVGFRRDRQTVSQARPSVRECNVEGGDVCMP